MPQSFGPENARLTVRTGRTGAASKAGHDLLIEVKSWSATLDPEADPALTLTADSRSLRVLEGTGGVQALDDDDRAGIRQTIDDEVLEGRPIAFELVSGADGGLVGTAIVKQTDWGMKPYSALFGTLKVADEVEVAVDTRVP